MSKRIPASIPSSLLVLSSLDIDRITSAFTPNELINLMAKSFAVASSPRSSTSSAPTLADNRDAALDVYMPHRTSISSKNHTVLFMPARIFFPAGAGAEAVDDCGTATNRADVLGGTTIKVISVPRPTESASNSKIRGLPATILVLDEETGNVKAVVNAKSLTALRTAAGSLLSTMLVGPTYPSTIVAFGAGKQAQMHILLHLSHFPSIRTCTIVARSSLSPNLDDIKNVLGPRFASVHFNYLVSSSLTEEKEVDEHELKDVVQNSSIIICATFSTRPLFPSSWVQDGTHVILVGSFKPEMREVDRELVLRAISPCQIREMTKSESGKGGGVEKGVRGMLLVDSRAACKLEAGELIDAGIRDEDMTEIGELDFGTNLDLPWHSDNNSCSADIPLASQIHRQESSEDREDGEGPITLFKSVGLGVQDVAIACAVVKRAEEIGIGTYIEDYDV